MTKLVSFGLAAVRAFPLAAMVLAVALVAQLAACGSTGKARLAAITGTPADIKEARVANTNQAKTLGDLKGTVDGLSPANVTAEKSKAQQLTKDAIGQNRQVSSALDSAAKNTSKDQTKIAAAGDPVRVRLNFWGGSFILFGAIALGAGMFLSTYLGGIAAIARNGGAAAVGIGILILVVAAILHTLIGILVGLVIAGLTGVAMWVYLHRTEVLPEISSFFNKTKAAVTSAAVTVKKDVA